MHPTSLLRRRSRAMKPITVLRAYPRNSPQAMARVLAMFMITDGRLDAREIEVMDQLRLYSLLGLSRAAFLDVLHDYCRDLLTASDRAGRIRLVDELRINAIVDGVDDRDRRVQVCAMILNIMHADGTYAAAELAVLDHVMARWGLSLEGLEAELEKAA